MADLTLRDAARVERDRLVQFSQYGPAAKLALYDSRGVLLREITRYWNRYRSFTKENGVVLKFKIGDLRSEYEADILTVADDGRVAIPYLNALYQVLRIDSFEPGESRIYKIEVSSVKSTLAASFFQGT